MSIKEYRRLLVGLKERIRNVRSIAVLTANMQMVTLYWEIGNSIDELEKASGWGKKTVDNLSRDLRLEFPDMNGISPRALRYMREFAKAYPEFSILQQAAAKSQNAKSSGISNFATRCCKIRNAWSTYCRSITLGSPHRST
jgi:hypothetical protein